MRTFHSLGAVTFVAMALAMVACDGGSEEVGSADPAVAAASALVFQAEASPLADFEFDTGLIPEGSPAQVQLKLSAAGGLKIEAAAQQGADGLAGKPAGGKLAIDLHMKIDGRLKVDTAFKKHDGDLPGLKDIDIPIVGSVPFDGLLLDAADSAEAAADLPETTLPKIPLGSIPGSLVITVAKGSKLTSKFHATCLSVAGGKALYTGESKTSGSLVLKGKIVLELPTPLNKEIELPEITVPIPEVTTLTEAAPLTVTGLADATQGACAGGATSGGDMPGSSSNDDGTPPSGGGKGGDDPPMPPAPDGGSNTPDGGTTPPLPAPVCSDPNDPSAAEAYGKTFRTNDGVDTTTTVTGIMSSAADVDYYRGYVDDAPFALLQPNINNATSGTELCVFVKCLGSKPTTLSCAAGTVSTNENGTKGCCVTGKGAVKPAWNCSGLDETAAVSFRVKNKSTNACLPYSFSYVF